MRHPTEGTLRRLVDEPASVADADREHVASCAECLTGLAAAREDAALTGAALAVDSSADVDAGWRRLTAQVTADTRRPASSTAASRSRWRRWLHSPVIAGVGVAAILAGAGAAAAADWLPIFHTESVAPVSISESDLVALPDLSAYGAVEVVEEPDVREVSDAAEAAEVTGLPVPQVGELPRGVTGDPTYQVGGQLSVIFTFSADQAAATAAEAGETLPPMPSGLDGSEFRLVAGPGLVATWSEGRGVPAMLVARAVAPAAYSSGVPFAAARDYLLSLPGLPEDVATQLRSFTGDGTTLPLPVPAELVTTSTADVNGAAATVLESRDGTIAGVVWVEDGIVTGVAGSLSADELLTVARELQ